MAKITVQMKTAVKGLWDAFLKVSERNRACFEAGIKTPALMRSTLHAIGVWPSDSEGKPLSTTVVRKEHGDVYAVYNRYAAWLKAEGLYTPSRKTSKGKAGKVVSLAKIVEQAQVLAESLPKPKQAEAKKALKAFVACFEGNSK